MINLGAGVSECHSYAAASLFLPQPAILVLMMFGESVFIGTTAK
jgi:hypothetical protein